MTTCWRLFTAIVFGFSVLQAAVLQIVGATDPPLLLLACTGGIAGGFAVRLCSRLTR